MKNLMKKLVALLLVALTLTPIMATTALAASWPSTSSSKYCEFVASKTINVYRNSSCTTRGTSSPAKSYNAYISRNDVCRILSFSSSYIKLQYPTSSGYKTGYIKRADLLPVSAPTTTVKSANKVTTYKTAGGASYGYIAKNDTIYVCGSQGSYTVVIYPAKSGSRAYKLGYIKTSDYNSKVIKQKDNPTPQPGTSSTWDKKIGKTVANIKSGSSYTYYYNKNGNISAAGGYIGQCTWYALGRFREVTGVALKTAPHAKYWLSRNESDSRVKVLYGASKIQSKSIAVRTSGTYGHVMFIEHVTYDQKGNPAYVYFTECNADGNGKYNVNKDCIVQCMTYSQFVSKKNPAGYIVKR